VQGRRLRLPALDPDAAVWWRAGTGVAEQDIQLDLADRQLTTVEIATDPGGCLQAAEEDAAALVTGRTCGDGHPVA
jgi:hypothetical protein